MKILAFSLIHYLICCAGSGTNDQLKKAQKSSEVARFPVFNQDLGHQAFRPVDKEIEFLLSYYNIAGASLAIVKDGKLKYAKGFGFADKKNRIKVHPLHQFRVASVSKLITAVAIFKLVESDKLSLQQQVFGRKGILNDHFLNAHIFDKRIKDITIAHLLNHSSGWYPKTKGDPLFNPILVSQGSDVIGEPTLENIISYTLKEGLDLDPGQESHYFNLGYCMLGQVIEKVSGLSYQEYVDREIFQKCGIMDTKMGKNQIEERYENEVFYHDSRLRKSFAGTGELVPRPYGGTPIELLGPSGGWVSTAIDLMRLVNTIDGFDTVPDILSEESVQAMTTTQKKFLPMGWIGVNEDMDWWRTGTLAGTHALVIRKNNGISYALLANSSSRLGARFSAEMYSAIERGLKKIDQWPDYDLFDVFDRRITKVEALSSSKMIDNNLYDNIPKPAIPLLTKK